MLEFLNYKCQTHLIPDKSQFRKKLTLIVSHTHYWHSVVSLFSQLSFAAWLFLALHMPNKKLQEITRGLNSF